MNPFVLNLISENAECRDINDIKWMTSLKTQSPLSSLYWSVRQKVCDLENLMSDNVTFADARTPSYWFIWTIFARSQKFSFADGYTRV